MNDPEPVVNREVPPSRRGRYDWVRLDHNGFHCLRCGDRYDLNMPCSINVLAGASRGYLQDHRRCRPKKDAP